MIKGKIVYKGQKCLLYQIIDNIFQKLKIRKVPDMELT